MHEHYRCQGLARRQLQKIWQECVRRDCPEAPCHFLTVISDQPADKKDAQDNPWNWCVSSRVSGGTAFEIPLFCPCRWREKGGFRECEIASNDNELSAMAREKRAPTGTTTPPRLLAHSFIPWPVEPSGVNVLTISFDNVKHLLATIEPPAPQPVVMYLVSSGRRSAFHKKGKLALQPVIAEFFAGEAGISAEFSNLGWKPIVHERMVNVPKWDGANDKLKKDAVIHWKEDFINVSPNPSPNGTKIPQIAPMTTPPPLVSAQAGAARHCHTLCLVCK